MSSPTPAHPTQPSRTQPTSPAPAPLRVHHHQATQVVGAPRAQVALPVGRVGVPSAGAVPRARQAVLGHQQVQQVGDAAEAGPRAEAERRCQLRGRGALAACGFVGMREDESFIALQVSRPKTACAVNLSLSNPAMALRACRRRRRRTVRRLVRAHRLKQADLRGDLEGARGAKRAR